MDDRCVFVSFLSRCAVCKHNGEKLSETAERYKMDGALDSGDHGNKNPSIGVWVFLIELKKLT